MIELRDDQLAERLRNMATDALLSGDDDAHRILSLAAVRLMLLADKWQPKVSEGVTIQDPFDTPHHRAFMEIVDDIWGNDNWKFD